MTHSDAEERYESGRPNAGKYEGVPLENNTRLVKRGDDYAVKLHDTDVVTIFPNGEYLISTGGWHSRTTADRVNKYSPASMYREDHVWYLRSDEGEDVELGTTIPEGPWSANRPRVPTNDNIRVGEDGNPLLATA